jgi:hypothetical protein
VIGQLHDPAVLSLRAPGTHQIEGWVVSTAGLDNIKKKNSNYIDRATAACRRSDCQLFADRGCHVVSVTDPYGLILGFLDRSRYFSIK